MDPVAAGALGTEDRLRDRPPGGRDLNRHRHPEQGYRACLGILRLGKRYGSERLEAAAARAERLRSYSYTTIKNILSSGADRLPLEEESEAPDPTPHHDNIRGAAYYAAKEIEC